MSSKRWISVVAACLLTGAACGDDEETASTPSATATGPSSTTTSGTGGAGGVGSASGGTAGSSTTSTSTGTGGSITMMPCNGDTCDLHFEGSGFGDLDGETIYWGIQVQGDQSGTLVYSDSGAIAGGSFSFDAPGVLDKGSSYNLNYYVELDGTPGCAPSDAVWRLSLPNVQTHLDVTVTYSANESNLGCSGHSGN